MARIDDAIWRKSTYSTGSATGSDCVEVAAWRKSTHSGSANSECVEAGVVGPGRVLVRDTTDRDGGALTFTADAWRAFAAGLKRGYRS
jgi:hypothetical protein